MARQSSRDLHTLFELFESVIREHPKAAAQIAFQFGAWLGEGVGTTRPGKKAARIPRAVTDVALRMLSAAPALQPWNERAPRRPRLQRKTTITTAKRTKKNG